MKVKRREGTFSNSHFVEFFTKPFGLTASDFEDRDLLDIGCGPRGSLEWADRARSRVGLDPLARIYSWLSPHHEMTYLPGTAEAIPLPDESVDYVSSFNSLDHVGDVDRAVSEIHRVLRGSGRLLVITDFGHQPTVHEPQDFGPEIVDRLSRWFTVMAVQRYRRSPNGVYASVEEANPYDARIETSGVLCALLRKE
jgi:SAM-dependent methyltransferase